MITFIILDSTSTESYSCESSNEEREICFNSSLRIEEIQDRYYDSAIERRLRYTPLVSPVPPGDSKISFNAGIQAQLEDMEIFAHVLMRDGHARLSEFDLQTDPLYLILFVYHMFKRSTQILFHFYGLEVAFR
jgi:hypothetical protein